MSEEETEVKSEEAVGVLTKELDYHKQQAQQNDANFRKERASLEELKATSEAQLAGLRQELESLKSQESVKSQYSEMDKDLTDESVRANIMAMQSQIGELTTRLTEQSAKNAKLEQDETARRAKEDRDAVKDELCNELDKTYDPKFRSKAVKMAQAKVDSGEAKPPRDRYDAYRLLQGCYTELAKSDEKKPAPTDTGKGSKAVSKTDVKKGTFTEVLKDMKKNFKIQKE